MATLSTLDISIYFALKGLCDACEGGDIGSRAFSVVCVAVLMLVCCVCGSTYEDLLLDESLHRRQHPEIDW